MSFQPSPLFSIENARTMLADGCKAIKGGQHVIDFSGVTAVDSAAVAVLLAWQREALESTITLSFINVPEMLQNLINLYGVAELLPNQHDLSKFLPTSVTDNASL